MWYIGDIYVTYLWQGVVISLCPIRREEGRLTAIHKVKEEEERKIEEWNKEDEIGYMGDAMGEL